MFWALQTCGNSSGPNQCRPEEKRPSKKGSWWLPGLKTETKTNQPPEPSSHFYTGASHTNCISGRSLHWTTHICTELPAHSVFLPPEPAFLKEFLEPYFNQQDWGFPHLIWAVQLQPTRVAPFWAIGTTSFGPMKLQWFGVICTRTDQLGASNRVFCPYQLAPLGLWECTSPFHWRLGFSGWAGQHWRCLASAEWSRPVQARAEAQNGAEQGRAAQHKADRQGEEQSGDV